MKNKTGVLSGIITITMIGIILVLALGGVDNFSLTSHLTGLEHPPQRDSLKDCQELEITHIGRWEEEEVEYLFDMPGGYATDEAVQKDASSVGRAAVIEGNN